MCIIGGVAVVAYLESQRVARILAAMLQGAASSGSIESIA
jgi:hypothetical protein